MFGKSKEENAQAHVLSLNLDLMTPNPFQPRKQFDSIQMDELSRSVAERGIIQPIVVRRVGDGYEIVAGERRWRAAKIAGLTEIPALVREYSDREMAEISLIENLQRADLNYFEEAEGYRRLIEEFQMTQEDLSKRIGKSQPTIANKMRLLKIEPSVKEKIMVELLTERHIRALLRLKTPEEQLVILKEIYEDELNVKETEDIITRFLKDGFIAGSSGEEERDGSENEKKQTVRNVISDMRIYINTIKAAVTSILDSGVDVKMDQTETEDGILLTISLPRIKK
ncbi:MAG: nucleoid occlusion protein [Peptococcaceae bacterium]|nr:nucleoid occlusion protein [Peptococcaceae bacterium]